MNNWLETHTFHYSEFRDLGRLVKAKQERNLTISLCLPTLNEESTIAKEIVIMKSELMTRHPLLDEIVVIDSGSKDNTRDIAATYGADVHEASEVLPHLPPYRGKGENLWKALYITTGDIVVYLDADIKNIHHRFVYGLLGPLLLRDGLKYTKAFYDRPIAIGKDEIRPTGGGRVTELVIRPLFSIFFPELTQIIQPLSGEYAGYREIFEKIPFPIGYGVETSIILDIYERWGLDVIGQVDLERRIHRNQDTKALGRMAFVIMKTFLSRLAKSGKIDLRSDMFSEMIQYHLIRGRYEPSILEIKGLERPPIESIPEYREKFKPV
jgi:glucosyl-3-phosphoglycerate synthase